MLRCCAMLCAIATHGAACQAAAAVAAVVAVDQRQPFFVSTCGHTYVCLLEGAVARMRCRRVWALNPQRSSTLKGPGAKPLSPAAVRASRYSERAAFAPLLRYTSDP
jgi:hypothetical protein